MTRTSRRSSTRRFLPLPSDRLALVEGWAMVSRSLGYVYRPSTVEGVRAVLNTARERGRTLVPRGSGYSYGDVALNAEGIVLDLSRMTRILEWNPETGVIRVEPGVTIRQLWNYTLEDGWWPPVVPGAMYPTVAGCASTNIHGKNAWNVGSFGDHVLAFDLLLPSGDVLTCTRNEHADIFKAAIGGLGLLGIMLSVTMQMKRVPSGCLRVEEYATPSLSAMFDLFERNLHRADYLVGWIDGFARGRSLGRGLVHLANDWADDPEPQVTLRPEYQQLPDTLLGLAPRSRFWLAMKPFVNDPGMRLVNAVKCWLGARHSGRVSYTPHTHFQFFHDSVPNWKWSFKPGGMIQYQVFVSSAMAPSVFAALLEGSQRGGFVPYLVVFKRHRADDYLLRYNVDGYSMSLDFRTTRKNESDIRHMLSGFTHDIVLPAGGRFYPSKDNTIDREAALRSFGPEAVTEYLSMKRQLDPDEVLQSDMYRRLFAA